MNNTTIFEDSIILPKEASTVPYSGEVDYITFSRVLDNNKVVASYKMYWLISLLEEVSSGKTIIDFRTMICKMIVHAWYPLLKYKLSFGSCDNLAAVTEYISSKYKISANCDGNELFKFIYGSKDVELNKKIKDLTLNVPYRFLSPFFRNELRGEKKVQSIIEELSRDNTECIYKIHVNQNNERYICINKGWDNYLKYNYRIIQGWAYYKLVCFLQKRNPNTPAIAMKLEPPKERKLNKQTKIWKNIIQEKHIKDLYTGLDYNEENYEKYGVLSIDHFIPWSFVLHDQMWNLVPCFKNINSKKSDNLLDYDTYIQDFTKLQYMAFCYVVDNKHSNEIEEYREALRIDDAKKFRVENGLTEFFNAFDNMIKPVFSIALNQGFSIMKL